MPIRKRFWLPKRALKAVEVIGMPECRINLAQAAVYMALAPKSCSAYAGIAKALDEVRNGPLRPVPDYLRDRHRPGSEEYGEYLYPHSYTEGYRLSSSILKAWNVGRFFTPEERGVGRGIVDFSLSDGNIISAHANFMFLTRGRKDGNLRIADSCGNH